MEELQRILKEITQLTFPIESKYPELYQFLDEDPSTIPNMARPEIDIEIMQDYLESLKKFSKIIKDLIKNRIILIILIFILFYFLALFSF